MNRLFRWLTTWAALPTTLSQLVQIIMSQKTEILEVIAAERTQFLAEVEKILNSKAGLPESDKAEIIAAIKGIVPDEEVPLPEGVFNVTLKDESSGNETQKVTLFNGPVRVERRDLLLGIYNAAVEAATAEPAKGAPLNSNLSFSDGVNYDAGVNIDSESKKAAADVVVYSAALALAQAQLDAARLK
jgi:hypothetical protein